MSENLVDVVVRRVIAELGRAGAAAEPANPQAPPVAPRPAARVWLTAEMLADRAAGGSAATLGPNEYLTPAARDYAAARGLQVRRDRSAGQVREGPITIPAAGRVKPGALTRTLGLVVSRPDAKVEAALAGATRGGLVSRGFGESSCWMVNARAMCESINAGDLAGGLIIDRYAAAPMILAAKIKGIRPVQGVSAAAVAAALRQFDANVLVVGHAAASVYEIRSMIDGFAAGRRTGRDRTLLLETIEQLEEQTQ